VGKQGKILEDVADIAAGNRQVDAGDGVEEQARADADGTIVESSQPGDAVQQGGLPCPGWAEQNRESRRQGQVDLESERACQAFAHAGGEGRVGGSAPRGWRARDRFCYRVGGIQDLFFQGAGWAAKQ